MGPKVAVKGKVTVKPKVAVKGKVAVKHRRLQAPKDGFQPPLKPATPAKKDDKKADPKKDDKKPDAKKDDKKEEPKKDDTVDPAVSTSKDGLPVSEYSKDVTVPEDLQGSDDQQAPKSSNLIKFAFMLFAAFITMY